MTTNGHAPLTRALDRACRDALDTGCGVAIVGGQPAADPAIPRGEVWEFPTALDLARWTAHRETEDHRNRTRKAHA